MGKKHYGYLTEIDDIWLTKLFDNVFNFFFLSWLQLEWIVYCVSKELNYNSVMNKSEGEINNGFIVEFLKKKMYK